MEQQAHLFRDWPDDLLDEGLARFHAALEEIDRKHDAFAHRSIGQRGRFARAAIERSYLRAVFRRYAPPLTSSPFGPIVRVKDFTWRLA
jgi:hypothetical protein